MEKHRVLIIEDNSDTRRFLETVLSRDFEIISAENAILGIEYARNKKPALIVLDIMLPILNGLDACILLKKDDATKQIPIIFLSSKNTIQDITQGLDRGADDYLAKPFDYKELVARIKARLRAREEGKQEPRALLHGDLRVVIDSREVYFQNKTIDLTHTEFDILRLLMESAGTVVRREDIIRSVWKGEEAETHKRTIDVHIRAIRKKIPSITKHIISVYGSGYKYEK